MSRRKPRGRPINGILVLDKPLGQTSNAALQTVKSLLFAQKAGHTGSLDPLATGVLPICFGEATKFSQYLLDSDKGYWVRIRLGERTETGDSDGTVVDVRPVPALDRDTLEAALEAFRGPISQVPSMYSAIKHEGQPLYKLARQGIEVERKPRDVVIHLNALLDFGPDWLELEIHCSKGTYVRTIAEDLGEALGCGGHVVALRRTRAGPFSIDEAVGLDTLEAAHAAGEYAWMNGLIKPIDTAVRDWPEVLLDEALSYYLQQGQPVQVAGTPSHGFVRLFAAPQPHGPASDTSEVAEEGADRAAGRPRFLGVGEIDDHGRVAPRRLLDPPTEQRRQRRR